jgi:hypothetical protein
LDANGEISENEQLWRAHIADFQGSVGKRAGESGDPPARRRTKAGY